MLEPHDAFRGRPELDVGLIALDSDVDFRRPMHVRFMAPLLRRTHYARQKGRQRDSEQATEMNLTSHGTFFSGLYGSTDIPFMK
jgi:hypothetical protein